MISFRQFLALFESERAPIIVDFHPLFKPTYNKFIDVPGVRDNLQEFFRCKKQWPQEKLKASFKDHALQGGYFRKHKIMECHLAGDVLMLYRFEDYKLNLLMCCNHNDLKGGRIASIQQRLNL